MLFSDHRLVISKFKINWTKIYNRAKKNTNIAVDHLKNENIAEKYSEYIEDHISEIKTTQTKTLGHPYANYALNHLNN